MYAVRFGKIDRAVSRTATILIVVVVIILIAVAGIAAVYLGKTSTTTSGQTSTTSSLTSSSTSPQSATSLSSTFSSLSTSSSTSTSSSSSSNVGVPGTFTYETANTPQYLDPQVEQSAYDSSILQNAYEPLLWYNGANSTEVIPWLAQSYSLSSDQKTVDFTLRSGINFQDGEPLNSTAVYFSLNRLLLFDGSTPSSYGTGLAWTIQQLLNTSLSYTLGGAHSYNSNWQSLVLAQNFVQVTGQESFVLHIEVPNSAFPYLISNQWSDIVAPVYVMQHDLALWNQSSTGYSLPYKVLSGNETQMISEYFSDLVATCGNGVTPRGCGTTYLDGTYQGSSAGTGPYTMESVGQSTNDVVLSANPNYWGGPYETASGQKIVPRIQTVDINYVPNLGTRELDFQSATNSGGAMSVDIPNDHLYDVVNRNSWINNHTLVSTIRGATAWGPYTTYDTLFVTIASNVSNPNTGTFYKFQPFADLRFRLAFTDAVNLTEINQDFNNNLGQVALNAIPPGFPPTGAFNSSIIPRYSYNLTAVQDLLLGAMTNPLTSFKFENGSSAPQGTFDNSFGCTALNSNGQCNKPTSQTISLAYYTGDSVHEAILLQIASAINNVSSTYNMGLLVQVIPIPLGQLLTEGLSGQLYMWAIGSFPDYPWVVDLLTAFYPPGHALPGPAGWNFTTLGTLFAQVEQASAVNDVSQIIQLSDQMNEFANQEVMTLWTFYPQFFQVTTSNIHGFGFNPSLDGNIQYFAALY